MNEFFYNHFDTIATILELAGFIAVWLIIRKNSTYLQKMHPLFRIVLMILSFILFLALIWAISLPFVLNEF